MYTMHFRFALEKGGLGKEITEKVFKSETNHKTKRELFR